MIGLQPVRHEWMSEGMPEVRAGKGAVMFDVYTKCSRCGEMFVADRVDGATTFESVTFSGVSEGGLPQTDINRLNKQKEELFRTAYPLCPDCMADTLDFVRGKA